MITLNMDEKKFTEDLLAKYLAGKCNSEEILLVERFYLEQFQLEPLLILSDRNIKAELKAELFPETLDTSHYLLKIKIVKILRYSAAAVIIISLSIFGIHHYSENQRKSQQFSGAVANIRPGGNLAVLTLGSGKRIDLKNIGNGKLAVQNGLIITKTKDGILSYAYSKGNKKSTTEFTYNMVETPAGGQYKVILPDGTKVWLNASSSLRYPVFFDKVSRRVELTGEGYFEVAHDKNHPFMVQSADQTIQVLGTHFNVNAYTEEPLKQTTLLEGRIKIATSSGYKVLKPGEQASVSNKIIKVNNVDTDLAVAWKNGDFVFENTPLNAIMRQISRWYNVQVVYQGKIDNVKLSGSISRSKNLSELLSILEITKTVHFKVSERRIVVMP
jgi:transmembrane sensor